jgi:phenylpropionate dioxygenase-like ring-hydroxylating dioxygenase large terminal subunit
MLMNFWYAIEFSQAIVTQPQLIQLFDRKITLYRDAQGVIQAFGDICPHRGASLSLGTVQDGCLVCPYHGWQFASDGACVKIPANTPGAAIPKRAIAATYPVQEKHSWIWLFWGDPALAAATAIPAIPQVQDDTLRSIQGDFHWQVNYARAMDNGLDFAHAPFVHAGAFGNPEEPEVGTLALTTNQFGAEATVMLKPNQPKGIWRLLATKEPQPVATRTGFALPNLTFLEVNLPFGRLVIWTAHVPIDDTTTVSKWMNFRSFFTGKWADGDARKRTLKIFAQDQPIVESQRPHALPSQSATEIHVAADGLQLQYREYRDRAMQNSERSTMVN